MLSDKKSRRRHLFVCVNERSSGKPACRGATIAARVQTILVERGDVQSLVTPCSCLGPCFDGPNAVVYGDDTPGGVWYGNLGVDDAPRLADHLMGGITLAEKITDRPGASDDPSDPDTSG